MYVYWSLCVRHRYKCICLYILGHTDTHTHGYKWGVTSGVLSWDQTSINRILYLLLYRESMGKDQYHYYYFGIINGGTVSLGLGGLPLF